MTGKNPTAGAIFFLGLAMLVAALFLKDTIFAAMAATAMSFGAYEAGKNELRKA